MQLDLEGVGVVITGAASGIGRACARAFAEEGAWVGIIDRDGVALHAVEKELASADAVVASAVADVTIQSDMISAIDTIARRLGGIGVAVACAGISGTVGRHIDEVSLDEWNRVMAVNVSGQFLLAKHALPYLKHAHHPAIVLMGSDSGFVAAPGMVPYNASKGAVVQLTKALSVDLEQYDIRVNCVCPSIVDTPMARSDLGIGSEGFAAAGYPVQSAGEVASHVVYLSSPVSRPINGTALVSDFGYLARSAFPA